MFTLAMYDALTAERVRDRDERVRSAYLRRLTRPRRRQRATDARRRRLAVMVLR